MNNIDISSSKSGFKIIKSWIVDHITYVVFSIITLYFFLFAPHFASMRTVAAVLRITSIFSIMAVGMTFVIITAEIDLSVGAHASFSGMICAIFIRSGLGTLTSVIFVLLLGALIGMIIGFLTTRLKIPSFLVSLGFLSILSGLALTVTNTRPVPIIDLQFERWLWTGKILWIPIPIALTFVVTIIGIYVLQLTPFGRKFYATGGNQLAARFSGVNTNIIKILAFTFSGFTASLAGLMYAARSSGGNPILGEGNELNVIAAVIIGGTSLFGGKGTIIGSVIGAIFIGIVGFGLLVLGFTTSVQTIIMGVIIIGAVALNKNSVQGF